MNVQQLDSVLGAAASAVRTAGDLVHDQGVQHLWRAVPDIPVARAAGFHPWGLAALHYCKACHTLHYRIVGHAVAIYKRPASSSQELSVAARGVKRQHRVSTIVAAVSQCAYMARSLRNH